ncbi:MAG: hypothetical protein IVW56_04585 [Candidatus Binataceae bacterium]|nr:hypothetical protein [Candidatus Binataceae bacterium]
MNEVEKEQIARLAAAHDAADGDGDGNADGGDDAGGDGNNAGGDAVGGDQGDSADNVGAEAANFLGRDLDTSHPAFPAAADATARFMRSSFASHDDAKSAWGAALDKMHRDGLPAHRVRSMPRYTKMPPVKAARAASARIGDNTFDSSRTPLPHDETPGVSFPIRTAPRGIFKPRTNGPRGPVAGHAGEVEPGGFPRHFKGFV